MWLSNLEIGVAQLHSIMEIVIKSPLVNWFKPSLAYSFCAGVKAIRDSVNMHVA